MLSFIKPAIPKFTPALTKARPSLDEHPGKGWYRIYTYRAEEVSWEDPVRYEGESLALVLFDIGAYKEDELPSKVLERMDAKLQSFERLGFELILRICYDTEGKGMVREPSLFSIVKKHIVQIAPLILKHADFIYVYQGVLVGSWGEMHDSRFLDAGHLKQLIELFLDKTEGRVRIALRKPVQYRIAFAEGSWSDRIGFFNDGLLGTSTHLGTFGPETVGRGAWQEPWSPEEEERFMDPFTAKVPYGGEAIAASIPLSPEEVLDTLRKLHVSYLNSMHDIALLSRWKEVVWEGQSLFDHVGWKMGYCFTAENIKGKVSRELQLTLTIRNHGFGMLYDDADIWIFVRGEEPSAELLRLGKLEGNLCGIPSGNDAEFQGHFPIKSLLETNGDQAIWLYAKMLRRRDGKMIPFEQESMDGCLPLGVLR